jgi:hypothetical protein
MLQRTGASEPLRSRQNIATLLSESSELLHDVAVSMSRLLTEHCWPSSILELLGQCNLPIAVPPAAHSRTLLIPSLDCCSLVAMRQKSEDIAQLMGLPKYKRHATGILIETARVLISVLQDHRNSNSLDLRDDHDSIPPTCAEDLNISNIYRLPRQLHDRARQCLLDSWQLLHYSCVQDCRHPEFMHTMKDLASLTSAESIELRRHIPTLQG